VLELKRIFPFQTEVIPRGETKEQHDLHHWPMEGKSRFSPNFGYLLGLGSHQPVGEYPYYEFEPHFCNFHVQCYRLDSSESHPSADPDDGADPHYCLICVGLIITNCIIMGRCEAFARNNPVWPSFLDGVASGCGYGFVLLSVAFFREILGFGTLFGMNVMPGGWTNWTIMVMAPGAFFMLGSFIWVVRHLGPKEEEKRAG
jgi:hypothetical protein